VTEPRVITLTGPFASGKSTVAGLLARKLGWQCLDSDEAIEREAGKAIARIFAEEGEAAFRERERRFFAALPHGDGLVVAAGGGATLVDETRRRIAEAGLVVCLRASAETIAARAGAQKGLRPLLGATDLLVRIRRLLDQRAALYALADFTVTTDALTPEEAAEEVARLYREHGKAVFSRPGRIDELSRTPLVLPPVVDAPGAATVVRTASAEYPAYVSWGALKGLGENLRRATGARRAFVVSDSVVMDRWGDTALSSLRSAGVEAAAAAVPRGDASKSLAQAGKLYGWLAEQRAERSDAVVALGGGMVGDLAGFVAATYLRGMPLVQAPTSLLGMVDASIGGKTAVNHAGAKNIVGAFYQPRAVVADVATLATLPRRELIEGLGEVIKHAFILDPELLSLLEERLEDVLELEPDLTTQLVRRNIEIKASIVGEDERETGGRRELLNYGHTLGHAFEAAGGYETLLHGEAVALGMIAAAEIGRRVGLTPAIVAERQRALLERAGLPARVPAGLDRRRILDAMAMDKKVVGGAQRWVLLEDVGRAVVRDDVPPALVESVLDDMLS
jgi:shikimate kinase/3-dehydroquinate synthase